MLDCYSLISRAWRGPAQRKIWAKLVVRTGRKAAQLARDLPGSGLAAFVLDLSVLGGHNIMFVDMELDVREEHLVGVLACVPGVLDLELELAGPSMTDLSDGSVRVLREAGALGCLGNLDLSIPSRALPFARSLLALSPALCTLSLQSDSYPNLPSPLPPTFSVTLPHLHTLTLYDGNLSADLPSLGLVAPSTFAQVTTLDWLVETPVSSPSALVALVGPTLLKLIYYTRPSPAPSWRTSQSSATATMAPLTFPIFRHQSRSSASAISILRG